MPKTLTWVGLAALLAGLTVLVGGPLLLGAEATARSNTVDDAEVGEVLIGDAVVITLRTEAGGFTPAERALTVANRLNGAFEDGAKAGSFSVREIQGGWAVYAGETLIISAYPAEADAIGTTPYDLALGWRNAIEGALSSSGGEEDSGEAAPAPAETEPAPEPTPAASEADAGKPKYYPNWNDEAKKIVPILVAGTEGIRVGAAQVVGPKDQIGKTKAVAQVELNFRGTIRARIYAYVPVSSLNVLKLDRVQGVSVALVGDVRLIDLNL